MKFVRGIVCGIALAAVAVVSASGPSQAQDKVVRIGFQKYGKLVLLKSKGSLDEKLKPLGFKAVWTEFPAGPQLLEAVNVGAIDFGNTGEAPPIFAQAAGAPLVYVAHEPPAPRGEAILVPKDSPIKTVADLKGRKVALNKGSNVHYLLVRALERAGLKYSDIEPVFLAPADARAAFERGSVHAWVIWDPFQAAAEAATGARTLADGTGIVANHQFYLAATEIRRRQSAGSRRLAGAVERSGCLGEGRHQGGRGAAQPFDRNPGTGPHGRARAPVVRHQAARRYGHRRATAHRRHLPRARSHPQADQYRQSRPQVGIMSIPAPRTPTFCGSCRRTETGVISAPASEAATSICTTCAQIAQAADELGYYGVLLPTGRCCEDSWVVASALAPSDRRLRFLVAVRPGLQPPTRGRAHDRHARPDLRRPAPDQCRDRRRPGREQGRRHLPVAR